METLDRGIFIGEVTAWYGLHITGPAAARASVFGSPRVLVLCCPCGVTVVYPSLATVPLVNTPHPCGDPRHATVRYADQR